MSRSNGTNWSRRAEVTTSTDARVAAFRELVEKAKRIEAKKESK